jgi:hypothetical protein
LREGYPHIAAFGKSLSEMDFVLAHELTHACLLHAHMPLWLEEGITQVAEHDLTGRNPLIVDAEMAKKHKRFWKRHGLEAYWRGEGFAQPGKIQELSYQLSEILLRLLLDEHRPRWFGWDRSLQKKLHAFLQNAKEDDLGQSAAIAHLGFPLENLAAKFLGPGDWSLPQETERLP